MWFFIAFLMTQVVFAKNEFEILPFLKIVYYREIEQKRVGRSPQEI